MSSADMEAASAVPFCQQKKKQKQTHSCFEILLLINMCKKCTCFHELVWAKINSLNKNKLFFLITHPTLIFSMQSLVFRPRTHCRVPLMFRTVAFPDKSMHFCCSASEMTHQETGKEGVKNKRMKYSLCYIQLTSK